MLFLRSLFFTCLVLIATVVWAFVCFLAAPLPYRYRYFVTSRWNVFVIWLAKVLCGVRYQIKGLEHLPDTPLILMSKHQSAWETIFFLSHLPRPLVFVMKKELLMVPFFGWALRLLRMIPIDRTQGTRAFQQITLHGQKCLNEGQWIILFPEGTRIPVGKKGKYKGGGARLAIATNTPIIPIAVNSGECWPKKSFIKRPGTITVSIGQPISPDGYTADALLKQVEDWIESEMRTLSPHRYTL